MKTTNMTTPHLRKSNGRSPWRRGYLLTAVALACFALSPAVRAVLPAPDGGYPGQNTAEGDDALFGLTTGTFNTAMGFQALYNDTVSGGNTALGYQALADLTDAGLAGAGGNTAIGGNTLTNNNSYQ